MRQIVLDTETTGLSPHNGDRIIEIGCVELVNRQLTHNNRHYYLNPDRDIDEGALRVHGITREFLADKPRFADIAAELADYLQGAELIIHNAPFDLGFLDAEFGRLGLGPTRALVRGVVDTLVLAKEMWPGKRNGLDALCDRLGVDNSGRQLHGALLDAELLADVYIYMTRGQESLVIDLGASLGEGAGDDVRRDLSSLELPVLAPDADELAAHEALLAALDQETKGRTVWRRVGAA
ncbi:DNA polymerase-3 subunit epsilon [Tepidimonas ignava]|uniref:DNA polymerase III subunit epsilon n=1 Tax=Tepidimonas ignava TaxID=114249 RepID=A0A4R3LGN3_9BURK|nr:DNA polymerase III subunit epsilon [Tepidimonas ignava]TCS99341.1 DNA polymerase-3 subunit epsilon [Tepidimonas ignava]TSE24168.1 DNA polymerase III subunit epsilon [Tepidimonas ignava]